MVVWIANVDIAGWPYGPRSGFSPLFVESPPSVPKVVIGSLEHPPKDPSLNVHPLREFPYPGIGVCDAIELLMSFLADCHALAPTRRDSRLLTFATERYSTDRSNLSVTSSNQDASGRGGDRTLERARAEQGEEAPTIGLYHEEDQQVSETTDHSGQAPELVRKAPGHPTPLVRSERKDESAAEDGNILELHSEEI